MVNYLCILQDTKMHYYLYYKYKPLSRNIWTQIDSQKTVKFLNYTFRDVQWSVQIIGKFIFYFFKLLLIFRTTISFKYSLTLTITYVHIKQK